MKKYRWIVFISSVIMILVNLSKADFSVYRQFSTDALIPVIAIAAVVFLLKTGVLSALLIGLKKLWERLHKK